MNKIKIGNKSIGDGQPVFVIAEAGVNHNGRIMMAKKMVDAAKRAGADAIKFQTFKAEDILIRNAPKAKYQKRACKDSSQFNMIKGLELSGDELKKLCNYCRKKKIIFLSTPFDHNSAVLLRSLGVCAYKISSGDMNNFPLLKQVSGYGKPIILSTGMSDLKDVKEAVNIIHSAGCRKLALLHCTSNYPAKFETLNLAAINTMKKEFQIPVGYSDHTEGSEASIAAVAMGACIIEKHFTLDKNLNGPDHRFSLEPGELTYLVRCIRNIRKAIGDGKKVRQRTESEMIRVAKKSIVSVCDIPRGARIEKSMIGIKRPGTGIEPKYYDKMIGLTAKVDIYKDRVINWSMVR